MLAAQVISEVSRLGANITLDDTGEHLVIEPGSLLTPDLIGELRKYKPYINDIFTRHNLPPDPRPPIASTGEVLDLARARLGPVETPVTPPAPPGQNPMVHRHGEKVEFFKGDWREAWPRDFAVYRGGKV